jgi:hypothetical protein
VKEVKRQKSELTDRYYRSSTSGKAYMRHIELGKQAHDCKALMSFMVQYVDTTGLDRRIKLLPGEISVITC